MVEITEFPFLKDMCLLLICHDAESDSFTEYLEELYDPEVRTLHICVDKRLNFIRRAEMLKQVRKVFQTVLDIQIKNVTTPQIRILGFYIHCYIGSNNANLSTRHRRPSPQRRDVPMSPVRQREPRNQRLSLRKHAQEPNLPLPG